MEQFDFFFNFIFFQNSQELNEGQHQGTTIIYPRSEIDSNGEDKVSPFQLISQLCKSFHFRFLKLPGEIPMNSRFIQTFIW